MLRLWPEKQSLFLLPANSWWTSGTVSRTASAGEGEPLLHLQLAAEQLVLHAEAKRLLRPTLDVVVGAHACRILTLPWQSRLRSREEQRRYAEVCFESEGVAGDAWVVEANYRHFGAPGLALAVRSEILTSLSNLAAAKALRLRSVLPLACLAYWRYRPARRANSLLVLDDGALLTALSYVKGRLDFIELQPASGDRNLALTQLVRRCQTVARDVRQLSYWGADPLSVDEAVFSAAWPDSTFKRLAQGVWL